MQYNRDLKKKLCEGICLNGLSTLKTANEYNIPIKTLENGLLLLIRIIIASTLLLRQFLILDL